MEGSQKRRIQMRTWFMGLSNLFKGLVITAAVLVLIGGVSALAFIPNWGGSDDDNAMFANGENGTIVADNTQANANEPADNNNAPATNNAPVDNNTGTPAETNPAEEVDDNAQANTNVPEEATPVTQQYMTAAQATELIDEVIDDIVNTPGVNTQTAATALLNMVESDAMAQGLIFGNEFSRADLGDMIAVRLGGNPTTTTNAPTVQMLNAGVPAATQTNVLESEFVEEWGFNVPVFMQHVMIISYNPVTGRTERDHVWQFVGRPNMDDGITLLSLGRPVTPMTDENGHGDASNVVNGEMFEGRRRMDAGYAIFSRSEMVNGVQTFFNICIYAPGEVFIDGHNGGTWNYRPKHANTGNIYGGNMTTSDWLTAEANHGHQRPAYFALYEAKAGEVIDTQALLRTLRQNNEFITRNPNMGPAPR